MKFLVLLLLATFSVQCRNLLDADNPFQHHKRDRQFFDNLANGDSSSEDIVLHNSDYPFDLRLNDDGTFNYKLEKLGSGEGTWEYGDGFVKLYAERKRFVMKMELHNIDLESGATSLVFADRFGHKFLPMTTQRN